MATGEGAIAYKGESLNGGGGSLVMDFTGITSLPGGTVLPAASLLGLSDDDPENSITKDPVLTLVAGAQGAVNSSAGAVTINVTGDTLVMVTTALALRSRHWAAAAAACSSTSASMTSLASTRCRSGSSSAARAAATIAAATSPTAPSPAACWLPAMERWHDLPVDRRWRRPFGDHCHSHQGMIGGMSGQLGGTDGTGNSGGKVDIEQNGLLFVEGEGSFGALLQSIGGGGGYPTSR